MKMTSNLLTCLFIFLFSCTQHEEIKSPTLKKINTVFLDSIKKNSDSNYIKKYARKDFATAEYFLNYKDSTICQVMGDTALKVRQVIISKKNIRTYFAQYYPNGQLMAEYLFDNYGQYNGPAKYYFENGFVKSMGDYKHGLSTGIWKEFNEKGELSNSIKYDNNGTRIN